MSIVFTKEEKTQLRQTLNVVVEDLRALYNTADLKTIKTEFSVYENENRNTYTLVIDKKEMYLKLHYSDWYMNLDKISQSGKQKICRITDYNLVYLFLQKYEMVRKEVSNTATNSQIDKKMGMKKIQSIYNKYTKEAIVEVEMPETVNKSSIEISSEDGKNIGKVTVGPVSFKIITSENVNLIGRNQRQKTLKK